MKQTKISIIAALIISCVVLFAYGNSLFIFSESKPKSKQVTAFGESTNISPSSFSNALATELSIKYLNNRIAQSVPTDSCFLAYSNSDSVLPIGDVNSNKELIPASSMKLLSAAIVLSVFKKDETLDTNLYGDIKNSKIVNAYLSTSGDPSFVSEVKPNFNRPDYFNPKNTHTFKDLTSSVAKKNVTSISTLTIDTSWLDVPVADAGWAYEKELVGALGAIIVNEGFDINGVSATPESSAAQKLVEAFAAQGITVGNIEFAKTGFNKSSMVQDKLVATSKSASIEKLIEDMLKTSNNIYAEQLMIAAAHKVEDKVTSDSIKTFAASKIKSLSKNSEGIVFKNASGYSRESRISCAQEFDFINLANTEGLNLIALSSKAKEDGTLTIRFQNYKGKLQAKTGTLNGVTALVGQLGQYRFAFLSNGQFGDAQGHIYQEKVVDSLNEFPRWSDISFK